MKITIKDVEQFLVLDNLTSDDESFLLNSLVPMAIDYAQGAGVVGKVAETPLAKLVVLMLVTHWYEHRESFAKGFGVKGAIETPYHIGNLLTQLKYGDTSPVETSTAENNTDALDSTLTTPITDTASDTTNTASDTVAPPSTVTIDETPNETLTVNGEGVEGVIDGTEGVTP